MLEKHTGLKDLNHGGSNTEVNEENEKTVTKKRLRR